MTKKETMYIVFEEYLYDYELLSRHVFLTSNPDKAKEKYERFYNEYKPFAVKEGWEIGCDTENTLEAYPDGSWGTSHVIVEMHEIKDGETVKMYY